MAKRDVVHEALVRKGYADRVARPAIPQQYLSVVRSGYHDSGIAVKCPTHTPIRTDSDVFVAQRFCAVPARLDIPQPSCPSIGSSDQEGASIGTDRDNRFGGFELHWARHKGSAGFEIP